jgi:hypothetical protein
LLVRGDEGETHVAGDIAEQDRSGWRVNLVSPTTDQWEVGWSDMDMVPDALVDRWQAVYTAYSTAEGDRTELARLSANVATVWREMAAVQGLAWWLVAALSAGAEAFERQAQDWGGGHPRGRPNRPSDWRTGSHRQGEPSGDRFRSSASGSVK